MQNRLRRLFPFFAMLAVMVSCLPITTRSQQTPVTQGFTITTAGSRLPTINLIGSLQTCNITIYGPASGFSVTAQAASDGIIGGVANPTPTWQTATGLGTSGVITSPGSFTGGVGTSGITSFGGIVTSLAGTLTGVIGCGNAAALSGTGNTNATIVAPTNASGAVIVTTPAPASTVPTAQSTAAAQPQQTTLPTNAYLYGYFNGSWLPLAAGTTSGGGTGLSVNVCSASNVACVNPTASPNAATGTLAQLPVAPCALTGTNIYCQGVTSTQAAITGGFCANGTSVSSTSGLSINTVTQIVAASGSTKIYVCHFSGWVIGTGLINAVLYYGTGTNCGTGQGWVDILGLASATQNGWVDNGNPINAAPAGDAVCIYIGGTTLTSSGYTVQYLQQ
jgi:hypothetical protein